MKMRVLATFNNVVEERQNKKQQTVPTAETNYNAGASHRLEIHKEINSNRIYIDRSVFVKSPAERANVQTVQSNFKRNGLREWNERNRSGNNK